MMNELQLLQKDLEKVDAQIAEGDDRVSTLEHRNTLRRAIAEEENWQKLISQMPNQPNR